MELSELTPYLFLLFGITSRVFLPWLISRRNAAAAGTPLPWSWRFVWPQLISVGIVILILPFVLSNLGNVQELEFTAAYLAGWAAADLGREADKLLLKQPV